LGFHIPLLLRELVCAFYQPVGSLTGETSPLHSKSRPQGQNV
jgi:hypothetical protein